MSQDLHRKFGFYRYPSFDLWPAPDSLNSTLGRDGIPAMGSTNRGAPRVKDDYYLTPVAGILKFLTEFEKDREREALDLPGKQLTILDPCAGGDASHPASYPTAITKFAPWRGARIRTIDIRPDSRARVHADYFLFKVVEPPWIIISNPPFKLAIEFIRKALADVRPGGLVIMLCRLDFFGTISRLAFWQADMPILTYVHSKRMKFLLDIKNTDSNEYAHFVWKRDARRRFTKLRVI